MANPTNKKPKGGEMTASGRLRRGNSIKANPEVDGSTWRVKLRASMISFDDRAQNDMSRSHPVLEQTEIF